MKTRRQGNAIVLTVPTKFGIEEILTTLQLKVKMILLPSLRKKAIFLKKLLQKEKRLMLVRSSLMTLLSERK